MSVQPQSQRFTSAEKHKVLKTTDSRKGFYIPNGYDFSEVLGMLFRAESSRRSKDVRRLCEVMIFIKGGDKYEGTK